MLKNEYLVVKIGFDTAEISPSQVDEIGLKIGIKYNIVTFN